MQLADIERASFSFIYSLYVDLGRLSLQRVQGKLLDTKGLRSSRERPEESNGIDPEYRTRLLSSCYVDLGHGELTRGSRTWSIRRHLRLFDSGIGTVTITLGSVNGTPLDSEDVHSVLGMVGELENEGPVEFAVKIGGERRDTSLYDLFLECVQVLLESFAPGAEAAGSAVQTVDWRKIQYSKRGSVVQSSLRWLDWEVADMERAEFQQPLVLTQLWLPGELYKRIFLKREPDVICGLRQEILSILLREIEHRNVASMDPSFANEFMKMSDDGLPVNMNLNSRLFMAFHPRSCLVFRATGESDPGRFLIPSLLDVMDLVRTRWHMSVVINALLDILIRSVRENVYASKADLSDLIDQRLRLGSLLEDPITYRWGGGSLKVVYEEAMRQLRIIALEEAGLRKMNLAHTLFSDRLLREEMVRFENLQSARKSQ